MKVAVICEFSGRVRDAFTKLGHTAISFDLLPSETYGRHIRGNVLSMPGLYWTMFDLAICHPECTHLAVSGARWFKCKKDKQEKALEFVKWCMNLPIQRIAIENPVSIISSKIRKPDQIIQPYQYGHPESKRTCLWLKCLPLLKPTNVLPLPECGHWSNQDKTNQFRMAMDGKVIGWNNPIIAHLRSKTYQGIANAMAEQWGILK